MTKQGASQWHKRLVSVMQIDEAEHARLCRVIDAGDRVPRYEVRRIVSGSAKSGTLRWELVSTHLRCGVALRRLAELEPAPGRNWPGVVAGAVWRLEPSGRAVELELGEARKVARLEARRRAVALPEDADPF